jgi:hypothetical protein
MYTNSLDHSVDLGRVLTEVQRVLKFSGILIVELAIGSDHECRLGFTKPAGGKSIKRSEGDRTARLRKVGLCTI